MSYGNGAADNRFPEWILSRDEPEPLFILRDRKSTRLNSSHLVISYAVFCLKKKKKTQPAHLRGRSARRGSIRPAHRGDSLAAVVRHAPPVGLYCLRGAPQASCSASVVSTRV